MNFDVCIVGGGPAGSTLALRLSRMGFSVVMVERSAFTRSRGGESVHPDAGILLPAGIPGRPIHRARMRWADDGIVDRLYRRPQIAVARPSFDAFLVDCARRAGVTILQPAVATDGVRRRDDWVLRIGSRSIRARFLVDASGRSSWLRTGRTRTSERTMAFRATFGDAGLPAESRIEALEGGWIWGSPMPDGAYAVIALIDTAARRDFVSLVAEAVLFRELPKATRVECHDATTYAAKVPCEDGLVRVGDASHSLDPLSSSGIRSAMQSALHAAVVINTVLRKPDRTSIARRFYNEAQQASVQQHAGWTRGFYAQSRFGEHPFWRCRKGTVPIETAVRSTAPVAIAAGVRVMELPCIAGEFVELRRGITHPLLPRAFAWIGGVEAESLLAPLANGPLAREQLLASWSGIAPEQRQVVFESLVRSRILE